MSDYPEHEKMKSVHAESQAVGRFIEWLGEHGIRLCVCQPLSDRYHPIAITTTRLLADYLDIDLKKIETERQAMLAEIREKQ